MSLPDILPIRPEMSLVEILAYSLVSFLIAAILAKPYVKMLIKYNMGKQLRKTAVDGQSASVFLQHHQKKAGTPSLGGILIWGSILATVLISRLLSLWGVVDHSLLQRGQVYLPLAILVGLGILGAIDDYFNIRGLGKNRGLDALPKLFVLLGMSFIAAWWFYSRLGYQTIDMPFGEKLFGIPSGIIDLGIFYIPFFMFVLIGTANAVNVTDGLDGLAGGLLVFAFGAFGIIAYVTGLYILAGFCGVVVGALAGFLWHNVPPAIFFMTDTGSLALGGTLAVMAFMINHVLVLPIIGIIFVAEMLSVIIQLTSKRLFKRKIFRSAPFHHHLEALEWGESKVTMRLWIIGAFAAFIGVLVALNG